MWKSLRIFLSISFILFLSFRAESQNLVYSFVDPCTKAVTNFSVPVQGGTTVFFLGQSRFFTASDVANGTFGGWVNQVYSDYRKVSPCSVQSASVTRNQITAQVVGSVVSSVMGSIGASLSTSVASSNGSSGGDDNASKGKTQSEKKKTNNNGNSNNGSSNSSNSNSNNGGNTTSGTNSGGNQTNGNQTVPSGSGANQGTTNNVPVSGGGNSSTLPTGQGGNQQGNTQSGGTSQQTSSQGQGVGNQGNSTTTANKESSKTSENGEVVGTTVMNVDVRNDKGSDGGSTSSGGGSKKSSTSSKQQRSNPMIISSDLTSAQNLDKSFTGIINIGMSQSSLTGTSSWGLTSMVWFNFKQFALNGRYTMIKFNNSGTLKFIHNLNLTGAYSFGNVFGFLGYSVILNAGKYGITGGNISGAITKTPDDKNLFISPSITAFYTKPIQANKKLTISPEIYVISTPVVYSSVDKITVTDRYFSGFLGSGFDYQLSRRFKLNLNYKANLSTNPEFPILSFFLIGSKVNL
jgi:hypothetical protein